MFKGVTDDNGKAIREDNVFTELKKNNIFCVNFYHCFFKKKN